MAEVESVEEQLRRWNPPPEDHRTALVVGTKVPEGDTRATNHPDLETVNRHIAAARGGAAGSDDDLGSDEYGDEFDDMSADQLRDAAEERDLSKGGSKADLRRRIREYDAEDDDDEDDEE